MRRIMRNLGMALACLALLGMVSTVLADTKFKNIQALKGKSDDEIKKAMQEWNKALGVKCMACHKAMKNPEGDELDAKKVTRAMVKLTDEANAALKDKKITCFGCHRGNAKVGKVEDNVAVEKGKEDAAKAMKEMVVALNGKFSGDLKGAAITCGSCHHGQPKIPAQP